MAIERIIFGVDKGKEAFEKTDRNVVALDASLIAHKAETASKHIAETGNNANGRYIRFDDGTQICWNVEANITTTTFNAGNVFTAGNVEVTFPAFFIETPSVSESSVSNSQNTWGSINSVTNLGCNIRIFGVTDSDTCYPKYLATGRWKI